VDTAHITARPIGHPTVALLQRREPSTVLAGSILGVQAEIWRWTNLHDWRTVTRPDPTMH
jgi:hypothetical protein